ncbi:MAG: phosphopantothenoylcysteine decarboxylase [Phycisphaerae bacterium]|jgi:phosphopantothenoylcysteine synthetase/decarboxylase
MKSNRSHFLITAGGTREYIDPVRFITNASSGKMGFALANAALKSGHKVTLITTAKNPQFKIKNSKLKIEEVVSADEMFEAVKKHFKKCDCLIMAAAVSDYTPIKKSKIKIKKSNTDLTIKLKPTPDILKWAGKNKKRNQIVSGFALEDKNLRKNAEKKLKDKNLDMIIANTPLAIGSENTEVQIKITDGKWIKMQSAGKTAIAGQIIHLMENLCSQSRK